MHTQLKTSLVTRWSICYFCQLGRDSHKNSYPATLFHTHTHTHTHCLSGSVILVGEMQRTLKRCWLSKMSIRLERTPCWCLRTSSKHTYLSVALQIAGLIVASTIPLWKFLDTLLYVLCIDGHAITSLFCQPYVTKFCQNFYAKYDT